MYLVSSCNKTFDCESLKAFKSLKEYKYFVDDLARNVYACHYPANDLAAIKVPVYLIIFESRYYIFHILGFETEW